MKPLVVVVGLDFADARRYVIANRETRPILREAVVISCSGARSHLGIRVAKVIETPAAKLGRDYVRVMEHLRRVVATEPKAPLT